MASARDQAQLSCRLGSLQTGPPNSSQLMGLKTMYTKKVTREDIAHVEELQSLWTETHKCVITYHTASFSKVLRWSKSLSQPTKNPWNSTSIVRSISGGTHWYFKQVILNLTHALTSSFSPQSTCTNSSLWFLCWKGPRSETHSSLHLASWIYLCRTIFWQFHRPMSNSSIKELLQITCLCGSSSLF